MHEPQSPNRRVAFFGGSFDPPHLGHLAVARAAMAALALDEVLFAPVGAQPLKATGSTAGFEDRMAMTRLAIEDTPAFSVSAADAPQPSGAPNYTLETLQQLHAELPADCALFCLMGADSFFSLQRWHRAAELPFAASLIVASRPGQPLNDLRNALPAGLAMQPAAGQESADDDVQLKTFELVNSVGERAALYLLPEVDVEISASDIRAQIHSGTGALPADRRLLPIKVAAYIHAHGLYR